ncbi:MAG: hypothetical protein QXR87_07325 [Candidatus Hadarchaeales archaeon]
MDEVTVRLPASGLGYQVGLYGEIFQSSKWGNKIVPYYDHRILNWIAGWVRDRMVRNFRTTIIITGEEGFGKSCLAAHILIRLGMRTPKPSWTFTEVAEAVKEGVGRPGHLVWVDEGTLPFYSDDWVMTYEKHLIKALQIGRVFRNVFVICAPHLKMLAKKAREWLVDAWIHLPSTVTLRRGVAVFSTPKRRTQELETIWHRRFYFSFPAIQKDTCCMADVDPKAWWDEYMELKLRHASEQVVKLMLEIQKEEGKRSLEELQDYLIQPGLSEAGEISVEEEMEIPAQEIEQELELETE